MHFEDVGDVFALDITEDVDEPLEVAVRRADPQEVDLFAGHPGITVGRRSEDKVI